MTVARASISRYSLLACFRLEGQLPSQMTTFRTCLLGRSTRCPAYVCHRGSETELRVRNAQTSHRCPCITRPERSVEFRAISAGTPVPLPVAQLKLQLSEHSRWPSFFSPRLPAGDRIAHRYLERGGFSAHLCGSNLRHCQRFRA